MKRSVLIFSLLYTYYLLLPQYSMAQPISFGRVTAEELKSTFYEKDSSTSAAILYDFGKTDFRYLDNHGFRVETTRTVRIKVYNKSGYEWGNVSIRLYRDGYNRTEMVEDIKGYVYNIENGMIRRDELDKKDIYEDDVSEKWREVKFAFPNIKEGSVLEYRYTVISPFIFKLDDWKFQNDIPVKWSEYKLTVPAFYDYMMLKQGYFDLAIQTADLDKEDHQLGPYTYNNKKYHWAMEDIPAYHDEQYMTTREDYIAKVMFQLSKVNYPGRKVKDYMTTWPQLVKDLMDLTDFGKNIKKNDTEDIVNTLTHGLGGEKEKAEAIYQYVLRNFAWNEEYSYAPSHNLKQLLKAKEGNCTDINLLLLNMLKKAGIQANAVLLSTRYHGAVTTKFPLLDQFNYIVIFAHLDGQSVLLDATDPELPFGMISKDCLNGYGLIADEDAKEDKWIDVTRQGIHFTDYYINLVYDESKQSFVAHIRESYRDYGALEIRKLLKDKENELERFFSFENLKVQNLEDQEKPLTINYTTTYPAEEMGDLVYINPFQMLEVENPFKKEERYFPVNYGIRRGVRYRFVFSIPEGYTLDEWPEDISINLDDKAVSFMTQSQLMANNFQLISFMQIVKTTIPVEQYQELRALYTNMVSNQMEKIVLKRTKTE